MQRIGADYILAITETPRENGVITLTDDGVIVKIETVNDRAKFSDIRWFKGLIMPGMINAHCHLELSHLKGKIDSGTGLLHFIGQVVKMRDFDKEIILEAIDKFDHLMYQNGIVAVGDICNSTDTLDVKEKSPIHYHSFVEMFDLLQASMTDFSFEQYSEVMNAFHTDNKNHKSAVPHAPYSVSDELFERINKLNESVTTVSIHNQELWDEDQLFIDKTGGFIGFYNSLGLNIDAFVPTGHSALQSTLPKMDNRHRTLLVHNTMTTKEDVVFAHQWGNVFWATCPNANLYIENKLPDYRMLRENNAKICIGTDSMSSNWQLSIVEEMKTIFKMNSFISLHEIFEWATLNGAKSLGIEGQFGSIEIGKKPGFVHLEMDWEESTSLLSMSHYKIIDF